MEKQAIFKNSINGFEKTAVLQYIDEMSKESSRIEQELQAKLDEMSRSREQLESQVQDFEEKISHIERELEEEKGKNQQLTAKISTLQQDAAAQKRQLEDKDRELQIQKEQNRIIKSHAEEIEQKSKKYDEAAASIGSVILDAKQDAKHIVEEANRKAVQITSETDQVISSIITKIDTMKEEFLALRSKMNQSMDLLNAHFDEIEKEIGASKEAAQKALSSTAKAEPQAEQQPAAKPQEQPAEEKKEKELVKKPVFQGQQKYRFF